MIKGLRDSSLIQNLLLIMSGTALAQFVTFALMPIVSRLYSPSDFGCFGAFTSVVTVISAGATLQFSQALVLPKRKSDAANLLFLATLSVLVISALCGITGLLSPQAFGLLAEAGSSSWLLWALPVAVLCTGINQILLAWCVRHKAFRRTAASPVIRSFTSCTLQIALGVKKAGASGLVLGTLLGDVAATFSYLRQVLTIDRRLLLRSFNLRRIRSLASEYRDFATYTTTQSVVSAASIGLPVLLLAHYYGTATAGYYALGLRVFQVPMALVLSALKQVLFQKANESKHQGKPLHPLFKKVTLALLASAIAPAVIFFVGAPDMFAWVFGPEWKVAGEYSRWLIFWMLLSFSNAPCQLFGIILREQRYMFIFEMIVLTVRVSTLVLGGMYLSPLDTIILLSVAGAILNLYLILRMSSFIYRNDTMQVHSAMALPS